MDETPREELLDEISRLREKLAQLEQSVSEKTASLEKADMMLLHQKAILDNIPDIAWLKDRESRFIIVNEPFGKACGHKPQDLTGKNDYDIWPQDLAKRYREDDAQVMETGERRCVEEPLADKEGKSVWIETIKTPFRDSFGRIVGTIGIARDITGRKLAEQRLQRSQHELEARVRMRTKELADTVEKLELEAAERKRAERERLLLEQEVRQAQKLESLGVLAGGIAHDFNNLLVGIVGNASLVLSKLGSDSPLKRNVDAIRRAGECAAELTRQLLAFSGKGKVLMEPLNLAELVEEMTHLLMASISKKARLEFQLDRDVPPIEADISQIRQLFMNLITNASDALGNRSGAIRVAISSSRLDEKSVARFQLQTRLPEGEYVMLEVSDTGCGMDEDTLSRIFDPFFTTKFAGRGLGLAAALGIIRSHRGGLRVESALGHGTRFQVIFPAGVRISLPAPKPQALPVDWRGSGCILVVDDEETVREFNSDLLTSAGFEVVTAADGIEAIEVFSANADRIDLVLLDMTMPQLSGEETLRELRRIKNEILVILTSGFNEQEAVKCFSTESLAGFLQKPYRHFELLEAVRRALVDETLS